MAPEHTAAEVTPEASPNAVATASGVAAADLVVDGLAVDLGRGRHAVRVLDDVGLRVPAGRATALVGESGSGKTLLTLALLGLLPPGVHAVAGRVVVGTRAVDVAAGSDAVRALRGRDLALVPQEPATALDPLRRVVDDVAAALRAHVPVSSAEARARATALLGELGVPPGRVVAHPHALSGGQRQRALLAAALIAGARFVIADEPTAALDVELRARVWDLLRREQRRRGLGLLVVTHDLALAGRCDDVVVLGRGRVVESGPAARVLGAPRHPLTRALLAARPSAATAGRMLPTWPGGSAAPAAWPTGCRLRDRCPDVVDACAVTPPLVVLGDACAVACVHAGGG